MHAYRLSWIQGIIVSAAVAGAAGGSALGGALSDFLGRKKALMAGDVLFTVGALLMAAAPDVSVIIAGASALNTAQICVFFGMPFCVQYVVLLCATRLKLRYGVSSSPLDAYVLNLFNRASCPLRQMPQMSECI